MRPAAPILVLALVLIWTAPARAAGPVLDVVHRGIHLAAMALPEERGDIVLLEPAAAIENLRRAIDEIHARSPFSARHLETLKRNGRVTVIYDAGFPKKQLASVTIAAFYPDFFQKEAGGLKQFLVVVGKFGVKWPTDKLAAVIVHELVGHGLQHYRGHRDKDRHIDLECEALIYEIRSHQDFDIANDTDDMVRFRKEVRTNWCADFSRYLRDRGINVDEAWGFGRPDVPNLLAHFDAYRTHLRQSGVSSRAVAAAKSQRADDFESFKQAAEASGSARQMLLVGQRYLKGLGVARSATAGAEWIGKAARLDHGPAQFVYGVLLTAGHGIGKDPIAAYAWLLRARKNGITAAGKHLDGLAKQLSAAQVKEAERQAARPL